MFGYVYEFQKSTVSRASFFGDIHFKRARKVLPRKAFFYPRTLFGCTLRRDASAVHARTRTEVYNVVGRAEGLLVVFDDDQRVSQIAQVQKRIDKPLVVPLVQPD